MNTNLLFTKLALIVFYFLAVSDQAESLDIKEMVAGSVQQINTSSVDISDPDGKKMRIAIDSNTVYDNIQKLIDLKAGDKIQVEYQKIHNKNRAISITKIELSNDDSI